jgi:hypothetical protein
VEGEISELQGYGMHAGADVKGRWEARQGGSSVRLHNHEPILATLASGWQRGVLEFRQYEISGDQPTTPQNQSLLFGCKPSGNIHGFNAEARSVGRLDRAIKLLRANSCLHP